MKLKGKEVDICASNSFFKLYIVIGDEFKGYVLKSKHLTGKASYLLVGTDHGLYTACKNVFMVNYNGLNKQDVFTALNNLVIEWNKKIDPSYDHGLASEKNTLEIKDFFKIDNGKLICQYGESWFKNKQVRKIKIKKETVFFYYLRKNGEYFFNTLSLKDLSQLNYKIIDIINEIKDGDNETS